MVSSCSRESMKSDYFEFENDKISESGLHFHITDNEIQKIKDGVICKGNITKNDERSKYGVIAYNISFSNCSGGKDYKPYGSMPLLLYYPDYDIVKYAYVPEGKTYPSQIILYTEESYENMKEIRKKEQEEMKIFMERIKHKLRKEIKEKKKQQGEIQNIQEHSKFKTIDGVYSYKDNSISLEIIITGDQWQGKTMIISGFGSDYDNQQATYESGTISGNDLYESKGIVQVGYVDGHYLHTSVGNRRITLQKE